MKATATIRTSLDLPRDLHRRLHEAASRQGCSARKLMLDGIERAVGVATPSRPRRRLRLPLVPGAGRRITADADKLHGFIEFP